MVENAGGSLINIGELSKPATILIEKVSDVVGGIAKPWQTIRVAKAEAQAELIRAQNRIEVSELEQRALQRMVREEGKKQDNIESVTSQAIPYLAADAKPGDIEDDWLTHFFEKSRIISDAEMQSLWGRILAGEGNSPGAFSKRTVDFVSTIDKSDAQLFAKFCSCVWMIGDPTPVVFDHNHKVFAQLGLTFANLTHLDSVGLIRFDPAVGFIPSL